MRTQSVIDVLAATGLASRDELRAAEVAAEENDVAVIAAVAESLVVSESAMADALAGAAGWPRVAVDADALDLDAASLLAEHVARRHLALPVARRSSDASVEVAVADPTDAAALQTVAASLGLPLHFVVATVSEIRAAIDRAFARHTVRVAAPPAEEWRRDGTAKVARRHTLPVPAVGTAPELRPDTAATVEQRVEALLLALIDAGVLTRAAYREALRRLLERADG